MLAWELQARFGFELVRLDWNNAPEGEWGHVVVRVGTDAYLDIEGVHTSAELAQRWKMRLVPMPGVKLADYLERLWDGPLPLARNDMDLMDRVALQHPCAAAITDPISAEEAVELLLDAYAMELAELGVNLLETV